MGPCHFLPFAFKLEACKNFHICLCFKCNVLRGCHACLANVKFESFENMKNIDCIETRVYFYSCILMILNSLQFFFIGVAEF